MHLRLIRHATLQLDLGGLRLLVDPQLDPKGARPPVPGTPNPRPSPLVDLPEPAEVVVNGLGAVLVTHLHVDHLDGTAVRLLPRALPVVCQPPDEDRLRERGFTELRPVDREDRLDGVRISRTGGCHGTGQLGRRLGPVSGFVLRTPDEPTVYLAGDSVWCDEVAAALAEHRPDVVVVNAGAARFLEGDPVTMTTANVVEVARRAPGARVVAVHFEAVSHCTETRADLHQCVHDEGLEGRVTIPEDGAEVPL